MHIRTSTLISPNELTQGDLHDALVTMEYFYKTVFADMAHHQRRRGLLYLIQNLAGALGIIDNGALSNTDYTVVLQSLALRLWGSAQQLDNPLWIEMCGYLVDDTLQAH